MAKKTGAQLDREIKDALTRYYRGSNRGDTRRISTGDLTWDAYVFVTDSPEGARTYGTNIEEVLLDPSARILREGTSEFTRVAGRWRKGESLHAFVTRAARQARALGYDVIHFKRQTDVGTAIMNPAVIIGRATVA